MRDAQVFTKSCKARVSLVLSHIETFLSPQLMLNDDPKAAQNVLHVRIQQHSGRKHLTIIEGIPEKSQVDVYSFLKRKLACGGTHKKDKGIVQLMGDHSFIIRDLLKGILPEYDVVLHGKKA